MIFTYLVWYSLALTCIGAREVILSDWRATSVGLSEDLIVQLNKTVKGQKLQKILLNYLGNDNLAIINRQSSSFHQAG